MAIHKKVDLRGLTPPEPVVRAKKLLTEFEDGILEVIVDKGPSRDDLLHFASFKKYKTSIVAETSTAVRLKIIKGNPPPEEPATSKETTETATEPRAEAEHTKPTQAPLLLITNDGLGEDNRRLSSMLMAEMLQAASESERIPATIILVNSGVALACEGSPVLLTLRRFLDRGAQILVSSESLDFIGLRQRLAAGTPADMKQISQAILAAAHVIRL